MTLVRATTTANTKPYQGLNQGLPTQAGASQDLLAEFSQLVEKIAGHFSLGGGTGGLETDFGMSAPAARPKVAASSPKASAETPTSTEASREPEVAATGSSGQSQGEEEPASEELPETEQALESAPDAETTESASSSPVPVEVPPAKEQPEETAVASDATLIAEATVLAQLASTTSPVAPEKVTTEELAPSELSDEQNAATLPQQQGAQVVAAPADSDLEAELSTEPSPTKTAGQVGRAGQANSVAAAPTAAPQAELSFDASESQEAKAQRAAQGAILEQLSSSAPQATPSSLSVTAPRTQILDRDALVSSMLLRPMLEQAAKGGNEAARATTQPQNVMALDGAGANRPATNRQAGSESSSKSLRSMVRANSERMLEKVEGALKEVAKSKDGSSLSFRLDPPSLGSVKVDVTLRDGALHARIIPENAQVAQVIRERAHELQQNLRRLGLDVDTVSVAVGGENFTDMLGGESSFSSQSDRSDADRRANASAVAQANFGGTASVEQRVTSTEDHWVA